MRSSFQSLQGTIVKPRLQTDLHTYFLVVTKNMAAKTKTYLLDYFGIIFSLKPSIFDPLALTRLCHQQSDRGCSKRKGPIMDLENENSIPRRSPWCTTRILILMANKTGSVTPCLSS